MPGALLVSSGWLGITLSKCVASPPFIKLMDTLVDSQLNRRALCSDFGHALKKVGPILFQTNCKKQKAKKKCDQKKKFFNFQNLPGDELLL